MIINSKQEKCQQPEKECTVSLKAIAASFIGFIIVIMAGLFTPPAAARESFDLGQVPQEVKTTIIQQIGNGKIVEIERDTRKGQVVFEVEFVLHDQEIEIAVALDGTLLSRDIEKQRDDDELTMGQLPAAARAAFLQLVNGGTIAEIEQTTEHGQAVYEAAWTYGKTEYDAEVLADGSVLEVSEIVPLSEAPISVQQTIAQKLGQNAKVRLEKKIVYLYEVETMIDERKVEFVALPSGMIIDDYSDSDDQGIDEDDDGDDNDED